MSQTLLLADDSVTIQRVIELTFADEDIEVIAVGDGQQAIDRIKADPPDIVLADTGMPERDGYEVATFIKKDPALAHIPVILLTGAFEPVDGDRVRQAGCEAVLVKPFEPQVVISRVRELLGGQSAPATSGIKDVVPPFQKTDTDVEQLDALQSKDPQHSALGPDETLDLSTRFTRSGETAAVSPSVSTGGARASDDALGDYLDRMDEAFEQLEAREPAGSGLGGTAPDLPRPVADDTAAPETEIDSLEGALSVLEGALDKLGLEGLDVKTDAAPAETPPTTPDAAPPAPGRSSPEPITVAGRPAVDAPSVVDPAAEPPPALRATGEPEASAVSAPAPSEPVVQLTSLREIPPLVEHKDSTAPLPEPEAPPEPVPPAPAPTPEPVAVSPPSLADAFASLLAAEQGDAERARTLYPWPRPASLPGLNEDLIERVTERVIARLSDSVTGDLVAEVVARVAEKLVRQEIDRTKPV